MRVFFDTNVLLDVIAKREEHYDASAAVWTLAEKGLMEAFVATTSFSDIYYIVRRLVDKRRANKAVHLILDIFDAAVCDKAVLRQAVNAGFKDFEDAVQYFAALNVGAEVILTRNTKHFPHSEECPALTPAEFLATWSFE